MITQTWIVNKEIYQVIVKGNEVWYSDRKMPEPARMIPIDEKIQLKVIKSRNKLDPKMVEQFKLTKEEKKEYLSAIKDGIEIEERLAEICKKDCKQNGSKLLKEEKE